MTNPDRLRCRVPVRLAPDREAWEKTHGFKPVRLEDVPEEWLAEAAQYYERDVTTLTFQEAIDAQDAMLALEQRVASKFIPFTYDEAHPEQEEPHVSYDPVEKAFYHYPFKQSYEQ